jgi:hypothetical protein
MMIVPCVVFWCNEEVKHKGTNLVKISQKIVFFLSATVQVQSASALNDLCGNFRRKFTLPFTSYSPNPA